MNENKFNPAATRQNKKLSPDTQKEYTTSEQEFPEHRIEHDYINRSVNQFKIEADEDAYEEVNNQNEENETSDPVDEQNIDIEDRGLV